MSELIQAGEPVPRELEAALTAGSSIGGARPKALLRDGNRQLIAKFSSLTDTFPIIRKRFTEPKQTLRELFARITFNILSGNTDDHARNHAAFWDGQALTLTPAYDICTYVRGGGEATQAMIIGPPEDPFRFSQVAGCVQRAAVYGLSRGDARAIVEQQLATITDRWDEVCDEAQFGSADRAMFRRMFPTAYALEGFS